MPRWEPDGIGRLQLAALELFAQRGYERVTVSEIAARAGLTERTFFRHYRDKREVLFSGADQLEALIVDGIIGAPDGDPLEAVVVGLAGTSAMFATRRAFAIARQTVIDASPELAEREAAKLVRLTAAVARALRDRGVPAPDAELAAEAGLAIFKVAFVRWLAGEGSRTLETEILRARDELRALAA